MAPADFVNSRQGNCLQYHSNAPKPKAIDAFTLYPDTHVRGHWFEPHLTLCISTRQILLQHELLLAIATGDERTDLQKSNFRTQSVQLHVLSLAIWLGMAARAGWCRQC